MANYIACELDRRELAEMSCITGVGGDVPHLVRIAMSGRPILAVDGCPFECTNNTLAQRALRPTRHVKLHDLGVKKRYHSHFNQEEADRLLEGVALVARELGNNAGSDLLSV